MTANQQENMITLYHWMHFKPSEEPAEGWEESFNRLAENIIMDFHPGSVLDVGCGNGTLVKCLRERGVEAWGIDTSSEAIQNALPVTKPYCQAASISEPFPQPHYDLIICIDVIEHLPQGSVELVIENISRHSNDLLISVMLPDIATSERFNEYPPGYWTGLCMRFGFIRNINYENELISPWAMHFKKTNMSANEVVQSYEAKLRQLAHENELRRLQGVDYILELSRNEHQNQAQIQYLQSNIEYLQSSNAQIQADLDAVLNSTSWQFMTRVQKVRERVIPIGSRREVAMHLLLNAFIALRREGLVGFFSITFQKARARLELRLAKSSLRRKLRASSVEVSHQAVEISCITDRPTVKPHTNTVDIIICVHNALKDVKSCLDSLLVSTSQPYHLILVDDGSDKATEQYLREFSQSHPSLLLRSEDATGYTYAANRGMRASSAEFVVLLNSDTILTPKWLDLCIACIQSDEKIGIVGPLSNTASWQSVPKIEQNGDWATNPLPDGVTPAHMAHLIATYSGRLYPEIPLLNGFCLIIRRSLLENVGLFDEEHFGKGYGEEDDLVLRARKSGWKMALADDVYIYHSQSKSYSSEKRHVLAERAGKILREKHGVKVITQSVHYCQYNRILEGIRARAQVAHQRDQFIQRGKQFAGKKILFVLPIVYSPNGGVNVIKTESIAMQAMGAQISYFHRLYHRDSFIESYPDLLSSSIFGEPEDLNSIAKDYDLVIATYNPTVAWMKSLARVKGHPELGYYIQGFEPWMYPAGSNAYKTARDSYTAIDDMTLFTKTDWTSQQVRQATGREAIVIGASLDIDLFRPRARTTANWPEGPLRIAAMIRPESPYREPLKTMKLLGQISQEYSAEIEIDLFGTDYDNSSFQELPQEFPFKFYGTLKPEQVANLFSQIDIFVDYSSQQAMGLTAMEAMACGCAVIVPQFGGASSYAVDEHNSLIVDTSSYENVRIAVRRLIKEEKLRNYLRKNAIYDICSFFPEKAAWNLLQAMTRF